MPIAPFQGFPIVDLKEGILPSLYYLSLSGFSFGSFLKVCFYLVNFSIMNFTILNILYPKITYLTHIILL